MPSRRASLQVNGQIPTVVSFPPTGASGKMGSISVMLSLAKGSANTITFSHAGGSAPDLDALLIQDIAGTNGAALVAAHSGRCIGLPNNRTHLGAEASVEDCNGGQNQTFARTARNQLAAYGNRCLVALGAAPAAGARLGLGHCGGANPAAWEFAANGALAMNGLCLDAPAGGQPALAACDANSQTQRWRFSQ